MLPVLAGEESHQPMSKLVIVESPAKAKTIGRYLGPDYVVESSIGHIRDIPARAADAPPSLQDEWRRTRYGIDVDNDFKPLYAVTAGKKKQVTLLKQRLKDADELYLATDEDREGEAIAWHLLEVLNPRVPVHRMVFHEITRDAIQAAVSTPRDLDRRLVDAQEARRILDRLFGYEVSPVLWRKVRPKLSAGRVQSPAIRIVVERERERMAFVAAGYLGRLRSRMASRPVSPAPWYRSTARESPRAKTSTTRVGPRARRLCCLRKRPGILRQALQKHPSRWHRSRPSRTPGDRTHRFAHRRSNRSRAGRAGSAPDEQ